MQNKLMKRFVKAKLDAKGLVEGQDYKFVRKVDEKGNIMEYIIIGGIILSLVVIVIIFRNEITKFLSQIITKFAEKGGENDKGLADDILNGTANDHNGGK